MIRIPNYNVVVPTVPELRLTGKRRLDPTGDRGELVHTFTATETTVVTLPWIPTASEWIEVYIDNIRLINPRITSALGGSLFEVYNLISNNILQFTRPITGEVKIICDTKATHWWGSVIINPKNNQAEFEYKTLHDFNFYDWPIIGGSATGFNYKIYYEPGPKFESNSYVLVDNCEPTIFNGNYQVKSSTLGSVTFMANTAARTTMTKSGKISGFGNGTVKKTVGISLYSEPVIITQPYYGYARLTTDRQSIAYTPNIGFIGVDTFSWALINQHGQIGDPKCVTIQISV
jgi:hypothetical protein